MALHISAYWPLGVYCTRLAAPHRAAYLRLLAFRSALHKISSSASRCIFLLLAFRSALQKISSSASSCIFALTGLPERIAQDQQLRIVLHISVYWLSERHCRRLAAPHQVAYFRLLAFRNALQKISSSASCCIFPLTASPQCIAQD